MFNKPLRLLLLTLASFFALEAGQVQVSGQWRANQQDVVSLVRSQWVSMGPKSMTGVLLRRDTEGHVKMEMETGVILPQARGSQSQQELE